MSTRTSRWPGGIPCWADLTVPDVSAVKPFYREVLGWTFADTEEQYGGYAIAQVKGAAAAGVGPLPQDGVPPSWTLYLASDDADRTAQSVREHGGTILLEPGDVGPLGRMFIAADPSGAAFGVWQAGEHIGAGIVNEPGALFWEDLRSTDPDAARAFYTAVFGYRTEALPDAGTDYTMFFRPGEDGPLGGMGGLMGAPDGTPSHWVVYFGVADAAAAVAATERAGGSVLARDFETPYGRMAGLADPAGAAFFVVQPVEGQPLPDRGD